MRLVGVAEVAWAVGWSRQKVAVYLGRGRLPEPTARLACGPVWTADAVNPWIVENGGQPIADDVAADNTGAAGVGGDNRDDVARAIVAWALFTAVKGSAWRKGAPPPWDSDDPVWRAFRAQCPNIEPHLATPNLLRGLAANALLVAKNRAKLFQGGGRIDVSHWTTPSNAPQRG